jgi:hypothetical protein
VLPGATGYRHPFAVGIDQPYAGPRLDCGPGRRSPLHSTMFSEILKLAQSAPAAGTIQRQINHWRARGIE